MSHVTDVLLCLCQVLLVLLNNAAQLFVSNSFPVSLKSKAAYFIKKKRDVVPKERILEMVILGDMATKPIEQLAALVDEVNISRLSSPFNNTFLILEKPLE